MKLIRITALMLVLAACGGGATDVADDPVDTTTPVVTQATVAETTTTTVETPTTEGSPATTVGEGTAVSSADLAAFREAAVESAVATSGRFEASLMLAATPELPQPFTIYMEGSFNPERLEMKMDMSGAFEGAAATGGIDFSALGDLSDVRFIFDGDTAYMKFPIFAIMGVTTDWVELPSDDAIDTAGLAGVESTSPAAALASFLDAGGEVSVIGTETIRGEESTRYRILFDIDELGELAGNVTVEDLRAAGIEQIPMDVWITGDGLISRYAISYEGVGAAQVLSMQYDLFDYGENIVIDLPDEDNVTPMDSFGP